MSLEEFLAQVEGNSLTYDEAACIADALVQALSFAHENGVLHLDIKPANVLIDRSGHVKLADFGMATLTSAAGFGGARGGTVGYMPPEQLNGEVVDERSDVFSLAAVLYESLCASAPFRAGTPADSLKKIAKGVLYPSDLLPDIPESAEDALLRALSPTPLTAWTARRSSESFSWASWATRGRDAAAWRASSPGSPRTRATKASPRAARPTACGSSIRRGLPWQPHRACAGMRPRRGKRPGGRRGLMGPSWRPAHRQPPGAGPHVGGHRRGRGAGPQIGSALAAGGWLMLILDGTPLLDVLPVAICSFALLAAWWLVWGRLQPAGSAVFTAAAALALTCGDAALAAVAAALAAYFLTPSPCRHIHGVRPGIRAASARRPCGRGGASARGRRPSAVLTVVPRARGRFHRDRGGGGLGAQPGMRTARQQVHGASHRLVPARSIASGTLRYLAQPMEIAAVSPIEVAAAVGAGCLSSILIWICTFALGYRRETPEGDRS